MKNEKMDFAEDSFWVNMYYRGYRLLEYIKNILYWEPIYLVQKLHQNLHTAPHHHITQCSDINPIPKEKIFAIFQNFTFNITLSVRLHDCIDVIINEHAQSF